MNLAYDPAPLPQVAQLIGVEERSLRNWIKPSLKRPALRTVEVDGRLCCVAAEAYEWSLKHAPRCKGLRAPPGYAQTSAPADPVNALLHPEVRILLEGKNPLEVDLDEFLLRLGCSNVPEERVRVITQAVRAIQNSRSIELRSGKAFPPDDVIKMLRDHGTLLVEAVDETAAAFSTHLLKWLVTAAGVSLAAKMPDAQQRLENEIREAYGNAIITRVRTKVENQVRGVRDLEFTQ